jgi:hypothetical protein
MSVTLPASLETAVKAKAAQRNVSVEQLVEEALSWYLSADLEFLDELSAWQEVRDEAWGIVEGSA